MSTFLNQVATIILKEQNNLLDLEIIVPNRRTGLFLKKAIQESVNETTWMPKITSIAELFKQNSRLMQAEELLLINKLYKIFIDKTGSTESFDDFYYWGEIILSDFDDIDKYLVNANKLFATIRDIKEIDTTFDGYNENELEIIKRFWSNVNQASLSIHKQKFLDLWNVMPDIYNDFTNLIISQGIDRKSVV